MQSFILPLIIGLLGGIAVGLQGPLASMMSQRIGPMGSVFVIHLSGALMSGALLLAVGGVNPAAWRSLPWYFWSAGVFGLVVISGVSYTIPRIGAAVTVTLIVTAQLILSTALDHFGLLGTAVRPIDPSRAIGVAVLFLGTWLMVR
jgi:transporter family-2 protein